MPDATERKALILCTFASGCIALAPLEWVSGFALVLLSGLFMLAHRAISRREGAFLALLDAWEPLAAEGPSVALHGGEAERAGEAPASERGAHAPPENAPEASQAASDDESDVANATTEPTRIAAEGR